MKKIKVMSVFGTRPEAIKMAPLVQTLAQRPEFESICCLTGQHREMLDSVMQIFRLTAQYDLNIMQKQQTLSSITTRALLGMEQALQEAQPDLVLVHGDTSTTFAGALAAFYQKVPVGHVEAGLRTYDRYSPFPEEMNRTLVSDIAALHFAPTSANVDNLRRESVQGEIFRTGNTVIDALLETVSSSYRFEEPALEAVDFDGLRVLGLTCHRRENLGAPLARMLAAVRDEAAVRLRGDAVGSDAVEALIRRLVEEIASESGISLPPYEFEGLASAMIDDFLRYGPLQRLLEDESVTEIMVNGGGIDLDDPALPFRAPIVYVERAGRIEYRPDVEFDDAEHVRRIINKIAEQSGKRCDDAHAMGCAMLPGGRARATYVVPPIAPDGPALNVRTFSSSMLGMEDLVRMGMLTDGMSQFLRAAVQARCPLVISGGTGSGKTTLLGALSGFIPPDERVITIEDTPELRLQTPHVERMQTREANTEGEGSVSMRELVALSLRRRPDRIIVGECRGAEAYDMLQAMQTDHPGSMTTVHANDPGNAISRLRTMVGYADGDLSRDVIVQQIAESLQGGLVVHVERMQDGARRVTSIVAIDPLPEGSLVIPRAELFVFDVEGVDAYGAVAGEWRACGVQPQRIKERMRASGVWYDPAWFFDR